MSDLNWDDVLGSVDKEEKDNPSSKGDFETLPAGPYSIVVQEADKMVSKTGKDMIKVRVQVSDGPYANRVLFNYIVFSQENPKAMRLTLERLAAFGVTRELIATTKPSIPQIAELLVGRKATAVVGIQKGGDYDGSNEIKSFKPLDGAVQPAATVTAPKPAGVPNIPTPVPAPTPGEGSPATPVAQQPVVPDAVAAAAPPDPLRLITMAETKTKSSLSSQQVVTLKRLAGKYNTRTTEADDLRVQLDVLVADARKAGGTFREIATIANRSVAWVQGSLQRSSKSNK